MAQSPRKKKKESGTSSGSNNVGKFSQLNSFDGLIKYLDEGHRIKDID